MAVVKERTIGLREAVLLIFWDRSNSADDQ